MNHPPEVTVVTDLMFTIVRYVGCLLLLHFLYSGFETVRHLSTGGWEYHTMMHGANFLAAGYVFICCYPAIRVAWRGGRHD